MDKMQFENGTLVSPAKVVIDGVEHEVTPAVYEGNTPFSAENINQMQDNMEEAIPEIVDDLITEDETKALSAKQGKVLNEKIESIGVLWTDSKILATKITAGSWQNTNSQDYVVSLKKGTYRMLVSCTTVGDSAGVATIRPLIDGLEANTAIRQTINIKPPLLTSVQVERYFTVTEEKDYAFNAQLYAEAALTVSSVVINIHKIA